MKKYDIIKTKPQEQFLSTQALKSLAFLITFVFVNMSVVISVNKIVNSCNFCILVNNLDLI